MKLATYNLWSSPAGMPKRAEQILSTLANCNADILCLQEVFNKKILDAIIKVNDYSGYWYHGSSGTAVCSRFPILESFECDDATGILVKTEKVKILVYSLHLPWKYATERERAIISIVKQAQQIESDYTILAGDFNCSAMSSVHQFLTGDRSLFDCDAYYFDLAEAYAETTGIALPATLCFQGNPRWGIIDQPNTIQANQRFDRILLKNPYPAAQPVLLSCKIFGTEIGQDTKLAPSDHYGVSVELLF